MTAMTHEGWQISRRRLLHAGVWAAPVIAVTVALPAAAASDGVVLSGASQWNSTEGTGWASFSLSPAPPTRISSSYMSFTVDGLSVTALQRSGFDYSNWTVNFNADAPPGPTSFGLVLTIPGYTPTIVPIGS